MLKIRIQNNNFEYKINNICKIVKEMYDNEQTLEKSVDSLLLLNFE